MESMTQERDIVDPIPQVSVHDVFAFALEERLRLEKAWSHETAHHSVIHKPGVPISRGQCGVSSVWLARRLIESGYQAQVAEGTIETDNLHEGFVWVQLERPSTTPLVVDITSDQFSSINGVRVHVGEYDSGQGSIGSYMLTELFDPYANNHRKLMRRYALLEQRAGQRSFVTFLNTIGLLVRRKVRALFPL